MNGTEAAKRAARDTSGAFAGGSIAAATELASSGNVFKAGWVGAKEVIVAQALGPIALLTTGVFGVATAVRGVIKESETLASALKKVAEIEMLEKQFEPLLKGARAARERLAELAKFAADTPFQLPEIARASKSLEIFTQGALATGKGLTMIGDAAAVSGRDLEEVAYAVGRLYEGLQSGRPVGEAATRLQEMGLITGATRNRIAALSESGQGFAATWSIVEKELQRAQGAMNETSKTLEGLQSTYADTRDALLRRFGQPFLEEEKKGIYVTIRAMEAVTPAVGYVADQFAKVTGVVSEFQKGILVSALETKGLTQGLIYAAQAALIFIAALSAEAIWRGARAATGFAMALRSSGGLIDGLRALAAGSWSDSMVLFEKRAYAGAAAAGAKSVALRGLGLAGTLVTGVLGMLGRGMLALISSPVAWFAAAAAGAYMLYDGVKSARSEVEDFARANRELQDELSKQIRLMQTLEDRQRSLTKVSEALAAARAKALALEQSGEQNPISSALGLTPAGAMQTEAQLAVAKLRAMQARLLAKGPDGLAMSEREVTFTEAQLDAQREQRETQFAGAVSRGTDAEKVVLLKGKELELTEKIIDAEKALLEARKTSEALAAARAREADAEDQLQKARLAGNPSLIASALARRDDAVDEQRAISRGSGDVFIRKQQQAADIRTALGFDLDAAQSVVDRLSSAPKNETAAERGEREKLLDDARQRVPFERARQQKMAAQFPGATPAAAQQAEIEARQVLKERERFGQNVSRRSEIAEQLKGMELASRLKKLDLDAEEKILGLKERGLALAEQEGAIRIARLEQEKQRIEAAMRAQTDGSGVRGSLQAFREQQNALRDIEQKQASIAKSLRDQQRVAREQLESDRSRVSVARTMTASAQAAAEGRFGAAGALRKKAIDEEERQTQLERRRELESRGLKPPEVEKTLAEEALSRKEARDQQARGAEIQAERELEEAQLQAAVRRGEPGSRKQLQGMVDEDEFRSKLQQLIGAGVDPAKAAALARGQQEAKIEAAGDKRSDVVASSLQAIGGGGGFGGGDPLLTAAERQTEFLQRIHATLTEINQNSRKDGPPPASTYSP